MSSLQVAENLFWVGALDPKLRVFDVVMHTDYGTTYNSYILKTSEGNILFETVKLKFFDEFIENLTEVCPLDSIKYIVADHTEPDHVGSLEKLLDYCSDAKVIASQTALNFLEEICNRPIPGIVASDGKEITIGGETLQFLSVPFLHWPDSIYTYIKNAKTLVTCDSFGCHYSDPKVFNDKIDGDFVDSYKYYFDMIMGPFKPHVRYALDKVSEIDVDIICPGHGPVLREKLDFYLDLYRKWSVEPTDEDRKKPLVVNSFVSAYGYTSELAKEINSGVLEIIDCNIKTYDMVYSDYDSVAGEVSMADGILFGTPTVNGDALPPVSTLVGGLNGIVNGGKVAGAYGSYGWSGEGPDLLMARLNLLRMDTVEPALKINFNPSPANREEARAYGRRFGKKVKEAWEKIGSSAGGKTYWKCTVCGEIFEGALPPLTCSVCGVGSEAFIQYEEDETTFVSEKPNRYVIIGGGAAAVSAAIAIRKRTNNGIIEIYSEEDKHPYYRPLLTEMISEEVREDTFYLNSKTFYDEMKIDIKLNSQITNIDKSNSNISLSTGEIISYNKLLIATGATPFVPPIKGADLAGVFTMRNNQDLEKIQNELSKDSVKKVTVVGGGLLGLEAACAIAKKNVFVTVIDTAPTILPRQTDIDGSDLFKKIVENGSINIITNTVVQEIYGDSNGSISSARLANGDDVKSDLMLISAGLSPNIALAQDCELECNRAIITDEYMRTSEPNIFSAGDCSISNKRYYGIWESAINQGRIAGANMAGEEISFEGKVYPATLNAFNTTLFAMGNLHNDNSSSEFQKIIIKDEIREIYSALYFTDDKIDGALFIGDISKAAPVIAAINRGMNFEDCVDAKILK